jgi:predicted transcriptional regulator of viral defense system
MGLRARLVMGFLFPIFRTLTNKTKTLIDCLDAPKIAGGLRMTIDILKNYLSSKDKNIPLLISYAKKMNNSVIYKRLGYLLEQYAIQETVLIETCQNNIKRGYSQLDSNLKSKKLSTKWGLWVPENLIGEEND